MPTETPLHRRRLLSAGAVAALSGLAGCVVGFGGSPTDVEVTLTNETDERYEVSVHIELRDETLLDRVATLQPGGVVEDAFENPEEAGDGRLSVSVDGGGSTESSLRVGAGTGLDSVAITIVEGGGVETNVAVR